MRAECKWTAFIEHIYIEHFRPAATHTHTYTHTHTHTYIHPPTAVSAMQGSSQLVRSGEGEASCSGTGGAGDPTGDLPVARGPPPPPLLLPPSRCFLWRKDSSMYHTLRNTCVWASGCLHVYKKSSHVRMTPPLHACCTRVSSSLLISRDILSLLMSAAVSPRVVEHLLTN